METAKQKAKTRAERNRKKNLKKQIKRTIRREEKDFLYRLMKLDIYNQVEYGNWEINYNNLWGEYVYL